MICVSIYMDMTKLGARGSLGLVTLFLKMWVVDVAILMVESTTMRRRGVIVLGGLGYSGGFFHL